MTQLGGFGGPKNDIRAQGSSFTVTWPRAEKNSAVSDHRLVTVNEASGPTLTPGRSLWVQITLCRYSVSEQYSNRVFGINLGLDFPLILK